MLVRDFTLQPQEEDKHQSDEAEHEDAGNPVVTANTRSATLLFSSTDVIFFFNLEIFPKDVAGFRGNDHLELAS